VLKPKKKENARNRLIEFLVMEDLKCIRCLI